jgi:uncharacterized protein YdeI (YjbR/CyaY-like superfamily)
MAINRMNPKVDAFFDKPGKWQEAYGKLRAIILDCSLTEEYKWMHPCYTLDGKNIVLIHGFKEYCAILFFKGVLIKDPLGILIQQTENVQSGRQVRFTSTDQIDEMGPVLKRYVLEAIEVEKSGEQVPMKETSEYAVPGEFQKALDSNPTLKSAFEALTPGRQRAYLYYFAQPKQAKTREARVEKYIPHILKGKGLNDS